MQPVAGSDFLFVLITTEHVAGVVSDDFVTDDLYISGGQGLVQIFSKLSVGDGSDHNLEIVLHERFMFVKPHEEFACGDQCP